VSRFRTVHLVRPWHDPFDVPDDRAAGSQRKIVVDLPDGVFWPSIDDELGRHRLSVQVELANSLPSVSGDRVQLQQVLFERDHECNLIDGDDGRGRHGMGMGLSISRSIIEAHAAVCGPRRTPPRGRVFHFVLPADTALPTDK